jgi:hypothetical protein
MSEHAAKKLSRFGLSADMSACLVEFEKQDGATDRLTFPASQLEEVVNLLLQVKQVHSEKTENSQTRTALVAQRVGVLVQPDATILDFIVGGAPMTIALPTDLAGQLAQILKEKLPKA